MRKITKILIPALFLLLQFSLSGFSQNLSSNVVIKGVVVEKTTGKALESATVQIFKNDTLLVNGSLTDKDGKFEIIVAKDGIYTVKVSFIGYSTAFVKNLSTEVTAKEINIGTIKLETGSEKTEEIKVEDEKPQMTVEGGKKIYDVKKDLTAQNGSALDLLKNIPSVDVDNDGNVSLRGNSNVKILIDGKPSAMLSNGTQALQNIPASIIEKIEVINNPSAKYEAEGVSGIINIIMKQNDSFGYNGLLKANSGTEDKYNISGNGSIKKNNYTINANYSFWNYILPGYAIVERNLFTGSVIDNINTNIDWHYKGVSHYGSFGIDYDLNKLNTLSFVTNMFFYDRDIASRNTLSFSDPNQNGYSSGMDDGRKGYNVDMTLTYDKRYEEKGRDFTTYLNYSTRLENEDVDYSNFISGSTMLQKRASDYHFSFLNWQADYVHPFNDVSKLETGLKSNLRLINGNYTFNSLDNNSGLWIPVPGAQNDADYKDLISAFYVTYSGGYKDFSYEAGIRTEHTYVDFSIQQQTQKFNTNYLDWFPNLSLSQKLGAENQIQFNYSRRIDRPSLYLLNPFVNQFDTYTKQGGNPYLKPEYTHSFELGYTHYFKFMTTTLNGFFRNTTNNMNFVSTIDSTGVTFVHPENVGTNNTTGVEFIMQGGFAKWWTYNGNFSYYNSNIFDNDGVNNFDKNQTSWTARFSTSASVPDIADIQLTYFYFGKQITSQGDIAPFQMFNLAISKSLFDKKLILGFRINDLFNQQVFNLNMAGDNFNQRVFQKQNSRSAFLTLTFNFGEQFSSNSKKSAQKKQREIDSEIQQSGN